MKFISHYSLFGAFWLAWILATISQFAINDGNYYESVNAGQNLVGGWRHWRRWYTCMIVAGGGVIAGWLVNYHYINGWFKVAGFLAVTVPCATVIMAVDHFLLPRLFNISRPLTKVPAWEETGFINIPAVLALLGAVFFGVTGTAVWPNGWIYASEPNGWGPVPVEAWAMAGLLYILGVAVARSVVPNLRNVLGFSTYVRDEEVPSGKVADIASTA
jgi:cytosine permease